MVHCSRNARVPVEVFGKKDWYCLLENLEGSLIKETLVIQQIFGVKNGTLYDFCCGYPHTKSFNPRKTGIFNYLEERDASNDAALLFE